MKKWLLSSLVLLILLVGFFIWHHSQDQAVMSVTEFESDNEAAETQRAIDNFIGVIQDTRTDIARRGAHAKGHACVKAYFDVDANIDDDLAHGVLQAGERYKAWIRFSNGSPRLSDDRDNDSRGIAIKLLDIEHPTPDKNTQEFLLHNSPAFFSVDLKDYNRLVESDDKIAYFLPGWNPFNWRLRELSHVLDTLAPPPVSPTQDQYFSNTAYKLGPHNVKYQVSACPDYSFSETALYKDNPHFLSQVLAKELAEGEACLQFSIQQQQTNKHMPIEDPSVLWKEEDAPYVPVAKLTLLQQQFDSSDQVAFCENLSFSPWNSLEEHRPIGVLNRVRKVVYAASAQFRHQQNDTHQPINIDW